MTSAGSQEASSVTLSYFSPRELLQNLASEPTCTPQHHTTSATVCLPDSGVMQISDAQAEAIRRGLTLSSVRAERFLREAEQGEVPRPIRPPLCANYIPVSYCSPQYLTRKASSVADALHVTSLVIDFALSCTSTVCPQCNSEIPLFKSPSALLNCITERHSGHAVSLSLIGRSEVIDPWAANRGFQTIPFTDTLTSVTVDSFVCSPESMRGPSDLLSRILSSNTVALKCAQEEKTSFLSLSGACLTCCAILPPLSRASLSTAFRSNMRALPQELLVRSQAGLSVTDLIHTPLDTLWKDTCAESIISEQLRQDLSSLQLGSHTLATTLSSLLSRDRALLSVLSLVHSPTHPERVKVIDLPDRIVGPHHSAAIASILQRSSVHAPSLIIGDPYAAPLPKHSHSADAATEPAAIRIPLTPHLTKSSGLVAHALGLSEPLAKLFATSHEARVAGLTPKSFQLGLTSRSSGLVCARCSGHAFIIDSDPTYPITDTHLCPTCNGSRFAPPASHIHFRGLTLSRIFNETLTNILPIVKALPKTGHAVTLVEALGLTHLSIGMPLALLEPNEQRLVLLSQSILRSTASTPLTIIVEDCGVGFSIEQHRKLRELVETKVLPRHATVALC